MIRTIARERRFPLSGEARAVPVFPSPARHEPPVRLTYLDIGTGFNLF